jgi:hypothetical protein
MAQILEPIYQLATGERLVPREPQAAGVVLPATAPGDPKDIVHIFIIGDARRHVHVECERCWQIMSNLATSVHERVKIFRPHTQGGHNGRHVKASAHLPSSAKK